MLISQNDLKQKGASSHGKKRACLNKLLLNLEVSHFVLVEFLLINIINEMEKKKHESENLLSDFHDANSDTYIHAPGTKVRPCCVG